MDKGIRRVDENKVKDHMDDIDTLLVFVGDFSVLLAASN